MRPTATAASSHSYSLISAEIGTTEELSSPKLTIPQRVEIYKAAIEPAKIDLTQLRELAHKGIPDDMRSLYWKVLLGYLPADRSRWADSLSASRSQYNQWHQDLIVNPRKEAEAERERVTEENPELDMIDQCADHPLSQKRESEWNAFFKDSDIIYEIEKDVARTFPHLHFFQQHIESPNTQLWNQLHNKTRVFNGQESEERASANPHYKALMSILFMWVKLNPGIAYVQGMNEIIGPIYYIFATDSDPEWRLHAEADAFFCFTNILSETMNNFCKTLDHSEHGIKGKIKHLNGLLKKKDPELWVHLEKLSVDPQFYSFRWLTLLLSQEFELPDVMRLWDSLFSDANRFQYMYHVCVAMLVTQRTVILSYDFSQALKLLQKYPAIDVHKLVDLADLITDPNYQASQFTLPPQYGGAVSPPPPVQGSAAVIAAAQETLESATTTLNTVWSSLLKFGAK